MECKSKDIKELIPIYLEQAIEQPDRIRVERHLETCEDCRAELDLLRTLTADTAPDPGEAFWSRLPSRIYRQVKERESMPHPRLSRFWQNLFMPRLAWSAAAVVLLAALASLLMVRGMRTTNTVIEVDGDETIYERVYPTETVDVSLLGDDELKNADAWADQVMTGMGTEAEVVLADGNYGDLYEEIADLDKASLDRLSAMLDAMKKEGRS